ncbi:MAG: sensor histidine kinase [Anaerolineae bacterium]
MCNGTRPPWRRAWTSSVRRPITSPTSSTACWRPAVSRPAGSSSSPPTSTCRAWPKRSSTSNLVSNAVKYSPDGGTVWVGGRVDGAGITVYVADQGIGIPPEEQRRIFDRFHRIETGLHRRTEGTGLGLYLVKAIVEAHGGRVWVESAPGRGSIFMFTLPRKQE